jgi:hypothetical protein
MQTGKDNAMKRLIVLAAAALLSFGAVVAVRLLPWWALALGAVALFMLGKLFVGRMIRKLFLMPFRAKGAVLKGASAQIHSISPVSATEVDIEDARQPRDHYLVEVTITPAAESANGPFGLWEPGELRLVRPESVLRPESDEPDDVDETCNVTRIQIEDNGQWTDDEGMKYGGPQRLRFYLAVQPGTRGLKFRYYFEEFGAIRFMQAKAAASSR